MRAAQALRDFLRNTIQSYEELNVLLLLRRESARTWSPAEASAELELAPETAFSAMQKLRDSGVLKSRARRGVQRFRFAPKTDELRLHVSRLARTYNADRATIAEMMSTNSFERVRAAAAETFFTMIAAGPRNRRRE